MSRYVCVYAIDVINHFGLAVGNCLPQDVIEKGDSSCIMLNFAFIVSCDLSKAVGESSRHFPRIIGNSDLLFHISQC